MFNRDIHVLLIGVGLIGGSVALAIKKEHNATIIGYDVNLENSILAKKLNIIDDYTENFRELATKAQLIILACPVTKAEMFLEILAKLPLKKNVIITDVSSTKKRIMETAERLFNGDAVFIGGHPMAGSHKTGPGSARAHLFENAFYILTPSKNANNGKVKIIKEWLKGTNAKFIVMDPEQHDFVTGVVSHFPHIIATSLVRHVQNNDAENDSIKYLAAGGFRDITRIASSSPELWRDVICQNDSVMLKLIDQWIDEMQTVKQLIRQGDRDQLFDYFNGAKIYRDSLPVRVKGAIMAFYDLFVDVLDKPGVISDITALLAQKNISITNIRIIEAREDVYGVLRLSFQTEEDLEKARECLETNGYDTYIST